jgi:hypothetical protein
VVSAPLLGGDWFLILIASVFVESRLIRLLVSLIGVDQCLVELIRPPTLTISGLISPRPCYDLLRALSCVIALAAEEPYGYFFFSRVRLSISARLTLLSAGLVCRSGRPCALSGGDVAGASPAASPMVSLTLGGD